MSKEPAASLEKEVGILIGQMDGLQKSVEKGFEQTNAKIDSFVMKFSKQHDQLERDVNDLKAWKSANKEIKQVERNRKDDNHRGFSRTQGIVVMIIAIVGMIISITQAFFLIGS